jgi:hypothetical protein
MRWGVYGKVGDQVSYRADPAAPSYTITAHSTFAFAGYSTSILRFLQSDANRLKVLVNGHTPDPLAGEKQQYFYIKKVGLASPAEASPIGAALTGLGKALSGAIVSVPGLEYLEIIHFLMEKGLDGDTELSGERKKPGQVAGFFDRNWGQRTLVTLQTHGPKNQEQSNAVLIPRADLQFWEIAEAIHRLR